MLDPIQFTDDAALRTLAPGGYHIALRVGFAFPELEFNTYPADWTETYIRRGYMLDDPIMRWIYTHTGVVRWSELDQADARGVLADAARHGLCFGAAVCLSNRSEGALRSFGSFARTDREFTEEELTDLEDLLSQLGGATRQENLLTQAEQEAFRLLSEGRKLKEIAYELGISESAVKQRLSNGRGKLSARTNMQTVTEATRLGWLD